MRDALHLLSYVQVIMLALLAVANPTAAQSSARPDGVTVGREAGQVFPQIGLPSLDGKRSLAISDFRGMKVLLIEFASW